MNKTAGVTSALFGDDGNVPSQYRTDNLKSGQFNEIVTKGNTAQTGSNPH